MTLKVIGAGFGRTGTLSLKHALEKLGFDKCYHMFEVHNNPGHEDLWRRAHSRAQKGEAIDWDTLFEGYQASVDWPSCNLWREQLAHFPDAKVILSLRDPDKWYDSVMATIYRVSSQGLNAQEEAARARAEWVYEIIWDRLFHQRMNDREYVKQIFNEHNEQVKKEVPPEKLLVFEASDGWQPLCKFLDVPVPYEPYPRVNTSEEFAERIAKR